MTHAKSLTFFLLILFPALPFTIFAQNEKNGSAPNSYFKLDFLIGPNFDFSPSSHQENAGLLSSRPRSVPFGSFRATHLFSKKYGWYAGMRIDYYEERKPTAYIQSGIEKVLDAFLNELLGPLAKINPAVDLGMVYRIERGRWSLHPSVGLGYSSYAPDRSASRTRTNDDGEDISLSFRETASFVTANVGLSANYFLTPRSFLVINAGYQHPLQSSSALLTEQVNGVETVRQSYRTTSAGRNLFFGIGYGLVLGNKSRKF